MVEDSMAIAIGLAIVGAIVFYFQERVNLENRLTKIEENIEEQERFIKMVQEIIVQDLEARVKRTNGRIEHANMG